MATPGAAVLTAPLLALLNRYMRVGACRVERGQVDLTRKPFHSH